MTDIDGRTGHDAEPRAMRVFVSSTFRDMQAEREELIKQVFPQLRRMCEARGVAWSEVDLRWGVTDEQKAEGAVLPICLAEIDRSRPYFIGLLGQRYGWVPDEIPTDLGAQLPWLTQLAGTSVTEMEILHGVLNEPDAAQSSFFYLRDPAWLATRSDAERAILGDDATAEEIDAHGEAAAIAAAAERGQRLDALKERIRASGLPTVEYHDPRGLGEQVLADFRALIDRVFPAADAPDALGREQGAHDAYASALRRGHVPRPAVLAQLDAHAASDAPPLLLSGEPGAGQNEIAAAWVDAWRAAHPDDVVVVHHVRASADSSSWRSMAARVVAALHTGHGWGDPPAPADDAAGARASLFDAIARAGESPRRSVLVVDDVDLFDDVDGARDLTWLPNDVPAHVRVLVTATGDRPHAASALRQWPTARVQPLDVDERRSFAAAFLARYAKGLDREHLDRLCAAPGTANALYLRTVLDELRQHGDHFTIPQLIEHFVAADTLDALLALVLARYERDFERDRPNLVGDAMRALWAARRGLTEPELLAALGDDEPLPHAVWSPLSLAAEVGLVTRSGLLAFATEPHRRAVEQRYVATTADRRAAHARLAAMFAAVPLGPRVVEELPWQLIEADRLDDAAAAVAEPAFTAFAYRHDYADVRRVWARLEAEGRTTVDAYRAIIDAPAAHPDLAWEIARIVTDSGHPTEALAMHRFVVDRYRRDAAAGADEVATRRLPAALVNLGAALWSQGELNAAAPVLAEAITLADPIGGPTHRAAVANLGLVERDRGGLDRALELFADDERMSRAAGDTNGVQIALGNRSQALRQRGDYDGALACAVEQESLCRSIGDLLGAGRALAGQAAILSDLGQVAASLERFVAHRRTSAEAGDLRGVAEASLNEYSVLRQLGRRDEAETRADEGEALMRRLSDEPLLARLLDQRARAAIDEQRFADADRLASEAVLTARSASAPAALALALGSLGMARRELGDPVGARRAHDEQVRLATEQGDQPGLASALVNVAAVDIVENSLDTALANYAAAERIAAPLGLHTLLVPLRNNRWQIHAHLGNTQAAIDDLVAGAASAAIAGAIAQQRDLLTKACELLYGAGRTPETIPLWADVAVACRTLDDQPGLQRAIGERALHLLGAGDVDAARAGFDEQERICRAIDDKVGLAACVGNRAIMLRNLGDLPGSLACIDEQLELSRVSNNGQGYLFATANRGEVLGAMGRVDEGLAALNEARQMAANWGLTPMITQLDQMIAALRGR